VTLVDDVRAAVASVDDPEYPGVSIADLGLVEHVAVDDGVAHVDLVPTFLGCPALEAIVSDVRAAVGRVPGVSSAAVRFVHHPVWSTDRVTERGRHLLAERFTVAVPGPIGAAACPRCGSTDLVELSPFGPSPCRAIHRCAACREPVEVVRT
jgi:ring-1,2-phenylacetyl-CoA epoxidase subunit PaaD